jgi:hypothetical protein
VKEKGKRGERKKKSGLFVAPFPPFFCESETQISESIDLDTVSVRWSERRHKEKKRLVV